MHMAVNLIVDAPGLHGRVILSFNGEVQVAALDVRDGASLSRFRGGVPTDLSISTSSWSYRWVPAGKPVSIWRRIIRKIAAFNRYE